ncbi:MAG: ParA family protein, partial [Armatimonadetes bacterium]|nr:ParA family protein [Armatimonadota bacterium]
MAGNPDPYVLARALAAVGKRLGVAAVIVDLRAGLSEAAAGILLDPRVHRVLVTTLSAQSVSGTEMMLRLLARTSRPERMDHPVPQIIVSQIPAGEEFKRLLEETAGRLRLAAEPFLASSPARPGGEDEATPQDLLKMDLIRIPFAPPLIALAPTWQDAVVQVEQAGIARSLIALRDWLPSPGSQRLATATAVGEQRKLLQETASRYVFAEAGEGTKFLATGPLRRLASDHQSDLPRVVVVGAKGSGKTYTFLHLVRRGSWGQFVTGAGVDWAGSDFFRDARFFPLLESPDLADVVQEEMQGSRIKVARRLGLGNPPTAAEVMSRVRSKLRQNLHEGEWTREWLELIGWGLGSASELESCFAALVRALRASGQAVVICLDGLEVLFDQAGESESQTTALQALFRDVPTQLAREAGRPVGLITFARQDLVLAAVRQNVGQLLDRYKPYALQWNREEALRLVYWTAREAGCLPENTDQAPESSLDGSRLAELLVPLWGRKLGSDRSKEGRSTDWVIAALSNLHGEVQARDLMRMLSEAARLAQQDGQWLDRILPPQSIRNAMVHCSQEKIGEVRQETPALRAVLDRLKILSPEERQLPLVAEHAGLHSKEVALLESHGLVLRVGEELFMPELFRLGLGFTIRARGRARVLSLLRQA